MRSDGPLAHLPARRTHATRAGDHQVVPTTRCGAVPRRAERGFTLAELLFAIAAFTIISVAAFKILGRTTETERAASSLLTAQQNARSAVDDLARDVRSAGYGIIDTLHVGIEVASDYRITLVHDDDSDGLIEPGERVTYFLDPDQTQDTTARTLNPYDYVLRRLESTAADTMATPGAGKGSIAAYMITQRSEFGTGRNTPLFKYYSVDGTNLIGAASDSTDAFYGYTVHDTLLGLPANEQLPEVANVEITVIAEAAGKIRSSNDYYRTELSTRVRPRNLHLQP